MRFSAQGQDDDQELLCLIADGDRSALGELYDRYAATLLALSQQIVGESHEAEELLEELFLEVWRRAPTWRSGQPRSLRAWLMLRLRWRAMAKCRANPELGPWGEQASLLPAGWRPPSRFDTLPIEDPTFGQLRSEMQQALASLGPTSRRVFDLCYLEGLGRRQVANRLGLTPRAVSHHLVEVLQLMERSAYTLWS